MTNDIFLQFLIVLLLQLMEIVSMVINLSLGVPQQVVRS